MRNFNSCVRILTQSAYLGPGVQGGQGASRGGSLEEDEDKDMPFKMFFRLLSSVPAMWRGGNTSPDLHFRLIIFGVTHLTGSHGVAGDTGTARSAVPTNALFVCGGPLGTLPVENM